MASYVRYSTCIMYICIIIYMHNHVLHVTTSCGSTFNNLSLMKFTASVTSAHSTDPGKSGLKELDELVRRLIHVL